MTYGGGDTYKSSYSCKGYVFINVTKPQPKPQP